MAFSSTLSFLLTLAPLIILITTSNAITNVQINQICSNTISKTSCFQILRSTPGVSSADLKGVGRIVLDVSDSKITNTKSIITSLIAKTKDTTLKMRYKACKGFFDDADSNIGEAKDALNRNDNGKMNICVTAAQTSVDDCIDILKRPVDPSDLKKRSLDVFETLNIPLIISNML